MKYKTASILQAVLILLLNTGPLTAGGDPFLEPYRLLTRAGTLLENGEYLEAADDIRKVEDLLINSFTIRHPAGNNAASLYSKIIHRCSDIQPDSSIIRNHMGEMEMDDLIRCADAVSATHDSALTLDLIRLAEKRGVKTKDRIPAERLKLFIASKAQYMTLQEITSSLDLSFSMGWPKISEELLYVLERERPDYGRTVLLKAELLWQNGAGAKAIRMVSDFQKKRTDEELKVEATLRLASMNYDAGRTSRAAEIYRKFAEDNPDHRYCGTAADRAARIYLSLGKWREARLMWRFIRSGDDPELAADSSVREAALNIWQGREGKAEKILLDNMDKAPEDMMPAFYYWLHRARSSAEVRTEWAGRLVAEFPLSCYTWALGDPSFEIFVKSGSDICGSRSGHQRFGPGLERISREDSAGVFDIIRVHPAFNALGFFLKSGDGTEASEILDLILEDFKGDEEALYLIADMLSDVEMKNLLLDVAVTGSALRSKRFLEFRFPLYEPERVCQLAEDHGVCPELVIAVMREESRFHRKAESRAGALGLMQITPSTGLWIARMNGEEIEAGQLFEPDLNMRFGAWYIEYLLERSGGSLIGAISAYNAGFGKLSGWRERFEPLRNPMIAAELIGIKETRKYLKRVLGSALMYRSIYTVETN